MGVPKCPASFSRLLQLPKLPTFLCAVSIFAGSANGFWVSGSWFPVLSSIRDHGILTHFRHDKHRLFAGTLRLGLARQGVSPALE